MSTDARVACLSDGTTAVLVITGGRNKIAVHLPESAAAAIGRDLVQFEPAPGAPPRPVPHRYNWRGLIARLNQNTLTASDLDAVRELLHLLGITTEKPA